MIVNPAEILRPIVFSFNVYWAIKALSAWVAAHSFLSLNISLPPLIWYTFCLVPQLMWCESAQRAWTPQAGSMIRNDMDSSIARRIGGHVLMLCLSQAISQLMFVGLYFTSALLVFIDYKLSVK